MKKIISLLLVVLSFLLVGCEKYQEVEMSEAEVAELVSQIDYSVATKDTINIEFDIDTTMEITVLIDEMIGQNNFTSEVEIKGTGLVNANLKSFEEMIIHASFDIEYLIDLTEISGINKFSNHTKGDVYIIGGDVYLDIVHLSGPIETVMKVKEIGGFGESDYNSIIHNLGNLNQTFNLGELLSIPEYNVYQSDKNNTKLETTIKEIDINQTIFNIFTMFLAENIEDISIIRHNSTDFGSTTIIINDNKLVSYETNTNIDLNLEVLNPEEHINITIDFQLDLNLNLNFSKKMPKIPSSNELESYSEIK